MPSRKRTRICTCRECCKGGSPADAVVGRCVGYNEYQEHQKVERAYAEDEHSPSPPVAALRLAESHSPDFQEHEWESDPNQSHLKQLEQSSLPIEDSIASLLSEVLERVWKFASFSGTLTFQSPPKPGPHIELPPSSPLQMIPNGGLLPLLPHSPNNSQFLEYQVFLIETYHSIESTFAAAPCAFKKHLITAKEDIHRLVMGELKHLEELKKDHWNRQQVVVSRIRKCAEAGIPVFDTSKILSAPDIMNYPLYLIYDIFTAALNIVCNISVNRCNRFILPMLRFTLQFQETDSHMPNNVEDGLPGSVQSAISLLRIQPVTSSFICCKDCFACYDYDSPPETCTYKGAPDLPLCGRALFVNRKRKGRLFKEPEREIHFQDFRAWLGRLLSRPGMEEMLDRDVYETGAGEEELSDIWDGQAMRNFKGPDGGNFISVKPPGSCRLVFAICMDNFNPFFNKHGGKHYSAGVISLICLNLPHGVRYLIENIFVYCVVPGPHEVELEKINNIIHYLVNLFLVFWRPGIYYSETPKYPEGRLVNAAIVPALGDLLAVRKLSGINRWCTQCELEAADMDNLDTSTWPKRMEGNEHRRLAEEWKSLDSKARNAHFRTHCIRWSELLRLPYWDPVEYTLVEFSHNLLSNNAERHLRTLMRMDASLPDGLGASQPPRAKEKRVAKPIVVKAAWEIVLHGTDKELARLPAYILKECCRMANIVEGGRHGALLSALQKWRRVQHLASEDGAPTTPKPPQPGGAPSDLEIEQAEGILSNSHTSSKNALGKLKKNVLKELLARKLREQATGSQASSSIHSSVSSVHSRDSSSRYTPSDASNTDGGSCTPRPSFSMEDIDHYNKAGLINALLDLEKPGKSVQGKPDKLASPVKTAILGAETLAVIHKDMKGLSFPSWIGRVPADLGSARHGTLSQDALRTVVTVILPSSLTALWGTKPVESRERQLLNNFLDFSEAINLALMPSIHMQEAKAFGALWLRYLRGARQLFPYRGLTPNQHLTMHLEANVRNFGPAPGQRTNICERINFLLQKMHTNSKSGEMEMTMLGRFCMMQNLRILLERLPPELQGINEVFSATFDGDGRGTLQNETSRYGDLGVTFSNSSKSSRLDSSLYQLLSSHVHPSIPSPRAFLQTHFSLQRVRYSTFNHSPADSHIVYRSPRGKWYAAKITDIIVQQYGAGDITDIGYRLQVALQRFPTVNEQEQDFYLAQGREIGLGCLCYTEAQSTKILIKVEDIVCPFIARTLVVPGISAGCMHVIPQLRRAVKLPNVNTPHDNASNTL